MRILHVASFSGNVGDNANHNGLRRKLAEVLPPDVTYDNLELRKFYRSYDGADHLRFDEKFVELANSYDLVIIGGGNFFEIWMEDSATGCTIDLSPETLQKISTRIVFFGLGFDTYKGYSEPTRLKFLRFLEAALASDRVLMTVRNDGSKGQLESCYGKALADKVMKVPDGGFFIDVGASPSPFIRADRLNVALSLAQDMLSVRFGKNNEETGYKHLVDSVSGYMKGLTSLRSDAHFILMPHIYSDLGIIGDVLNTIPDYLRRNHVTVGPYLVGSGAEKLVFGTYGQADCVVAMRFHANVCPIGLNVPTIGLSSYKKIRDLYSELGIPERLLEEDDASLTGRLMEKTNTIITNNSQYRLENEFLLNQLDGQMAAFLKIFTFFIG